jgi:ankyrin repeat protein
MEILIFRGADVNKKGGTYVSALHVAIHSRNHESFRLMLEHGADVNLGVGYSGTPVGQAIFSNNMPALDRLLELGAKIEEAALLEAIDTKKPAVVKVLLDRGVNPNAEHVYEVDSYGNALQLACHKRSKGIVEYLLDAGAEINAVEGYH